jgi:hypothetical protein
LLWLRDAESCGTYRSVVNENLKLIDTMFDFDREIFSSKVYRMATRSNMIQALLDGKSEDGNPTTSFPVTVTESDTSVEADVDESDVQTIRAQLYDTSHPLMSHQSQIIQESQDAKADDSTEVHRGGQLERAAYAKSLERLPTLQKTQTLKVLILGTSESGKSTIMKLISLYQKIYTNETRRNYKPTIFKNILDSMKSVLAAREILQLEDAGIGCNATMFSDCRQIILQAQVDTDRGCCVWSSDIRAAIAALWTYPPVRAVFKRSIKRDIMDPAE